MLSRERAEFMVNRIEKDLVILNGLKDYILSGHTAKDDSRSVLFKIHLLKNNLLLYKTGLSKMDINNTDCIMNDEELINTVAQSRVAEYEKTESWDAFINNFEDRKTSIQKVKTYSIVGKAV